MTTPDGPYRIRFLLSYFYYGTKDIEQIILHDFGDPHPDVMADSGGFSAWSVGGEVFLPEYMAWIERYQHIMSAYVNLDVIGNADATLANQKAMEDKGLRPLPVFHYGEPWTYLEYYCEHYDLLCLGGIAGVKERPWRAVFPWLINCFKIAAHTGTRLHGLGVSAHDVLLSLPFYSADSSSFLAAVMFRTLRLFDMRRVQWRAIDLRREAEVWKHASLIRTYNYDPALLTRLDARQDKHKQFGSGVSPVDCAVASLSAAAWMRYEQYLRTRHGTITVPSQAFAGPKYFIATGTLKHVADAQTMASMAKGIDPGAIPDLTVLPHGYKDRPESWKELPDVEPA